MFSVAATAFVLVAVSCKTPITVPDPTPVVKTVAADCGAPALRDLASHLLDDVTSALLSGGDWRAALAAVAARAGADGLAAVKCAVAEVFSKSDAQLGYRGLMDKAEVDRTQLLHDRAGQYLDGK
jgi:hypothetical protein